jgi:hypothetical protein
MGLRLVNGNRIELSIRTVSDDEEDQHSNNGRQANNQYGRTASFSSDHADV